MGVIPRHWRHSHSHWHHRGRIPSMLYRGLLVTTLLGLATGKEEVTVDTDSCLQTARTMRSGADPSKDLDNFLACVLARLNDVQTADEDFLELKSKLAAIENIPADFNHNLAKRQAEVIEDESRGWKNKGKKKKRNKEKKKKKNVDKEIPE